VVPQANGATDFSVLQNELKGRSDKIVLVAFDLLYLNGYDLRQLPLFERKAHLKKLVDGTDVQFSESFEIGGGEMLTHACEIGLEGVGPRRPLPCRQDQRLGQENLRPAGDFGNRGLCARRQQLGWPLCRPLQG
jgi:bifunctional non-homologous end joining protein LigD